MWPKSKRLEETVSNFQPRRGKSFKPKVITICPSFSALLNMLMYSMYRERYSLLSKIMHSKSALVVYIKVVERLGRI